MKYNHNGKVINIPDDEILKNMNVLELSQEEAILVWLEDNEYEKNEEQEALCKKAKDNRITATIHKAGNNRAERKTSTRERKANPPKEKIIAAVADFLPSLGVSNVKIENIGKIITFSLENEDFKIDLVQKRKKKE